MAFDGIITQVIAHELSNKLTYGKIEKIYQPGNEELVIQIHTHSGNVKLFASCGSCSARVCLTNEKYTNPKNPPAFCMLMRKHLQGGRITAIQQRDSERIIEMDIETQTELGFTVSRKLIFEIMGKHSNIILLDLENGKVIDSIKRLSIDINSYRQLLPGILYKYPPKQDKIPFKELTFNTPLPCNAKAIFAKVSGISPAISREAEFSGNPSAFFNKLEKKIKENNISPCVYIDRNNIPREFYITELSEFALLDKLSFNSANECVDYFYTHKKDTNILKQKLSPVLKTVKNALNKAKLKKQRLGEDLVRAENSDQYRIYGEILTANIHNVKPGMKEVILTNYYTGLDIKIPLDEKLSPAKNAQRFFKKYAKSKTAIKEKTVQIKETEKDIDYLESVLVNIVDVKTESEIDAIKEELVEAGYMKAFSEKKKQKKKLKFKPMTYTLSDGTLIYVGKNNTENDYLTMKMAKKTDLWFHTKDIPGSHVLMPINNGITAKDIDAKIIYEAAGVAAYHSKARLSENVPVDFVPIRYIKKPNGAKPGMVIFTHNTTVYVKPKVPKKVSSLK